MWFQISPFAGTVKSVIDNFPYFSWFWVKNYLKFDWFCQKLLNLQDFGMIEISQCRTEVKIDSVKCKTLLSLLQTNLKRYIHLWIFSWEGGICNIQKYFFILLENCTSKICHHIVSSKLIKKHHSSTYDQFSVTKYKFCSFLNILFFQFFLCLQSKTFLINRSCYITYSLHKTICFFTFCTLQWNIFFILDLTLLFLEVGIHVRALKHVKLIF